MDCKYSPWGHKESDRTGRFSLAAFFMVQLSYPYMTTGKTIALTRWTFVGKGPGSSLIAQLVKNPPAMQETSVRFLGWEDTQEKG